MFQRFFFLHFFPLNLDVILLNLNSIFIKEHFELLVIRLNIWCDAHLTETGGWGGSPHAHTHTRDDDDERFREMERSKTGS